MTAAILGYISSSSIRRDVSRAFVRAAFTSGNLNNNGVIGRVGSTSSIAMEAPHPFSRTVTSRGFMLYARENPLRHSGRAFSTAADTELDTELDNALDDLLGDAFEEAENPAAGKGDRGHIEGSHPFPKELVEKVVRCLYDTAQYLIAILFLLHALTFIERTLTTERRRLQRSQVLINIQPPLD